MTLNMRFLSHTCRLAVPIAVGLLLCTAAVRRSSAQTAASPFPSFDFRHASTVAEWGEPHDVSRIEAAHDGMAVQIQGPDPYFFGPAHDYPGGTPLLMEVGLKSSEGGMFQVFYFASGKTSTEEQSVRFPVRRGVWQHLIVPVPALAPGYRLRLDPPGERGVCVIESIRFTPRLTISPPEWPKPTLREPAPGMLTIRSGSLVLNHNPDQWGGFRVTVAGQPVATGHDRPLIGYLEQNTSPSPPSPKVRWLDLAATAKVAASLDPVKQTLLVEARLSDPDGGRWQLRQVFRASSEAGIDVSTECSVDSPREVVFLPLLLLLPGHGSFGALKGQALFAGVEYLENEPSSTTADLVGPGANRRVPSSAKITFPLMAVQAHGNYIGVIWDRTPDLCALFDSPDRTLGTEGHLLGLLAPRAEPSSRVDGELFPLRPLKLVPNQPVKASATIIGGPASSVLPAVMKYVELRGLPPRPPAPKLADYIRLAAAGWLDSPIRDGNRFRHAAGGSFGAQPAADAAWMMDQLADLCTESTLASRLRSAAAAAAAEVPVDLRLHAGVGHLRYPVAPLVLRTTGKISDAASSSAEADPVAISLDQAEAVCRSLVRRFEPDGSIRYRPAPGATDYGRTHFCDEANGLTAEPVLRLLEAAVFAGDRTAVDEGLRLLRILHGRFGLGVPRGAQTWEIPLHTPDILASAWLVKAFTLGYELTADPVLLEAARSWAWTGVPFVYLVNPTTASGPAAVGPYATIPVLGATNWIAPNWIGLPVQWCGLVYADSLFQLARLDSSGPWRALAEGITASGILQSYPLDHPRHGLLPDSFNLSAQARNPADINPGTLQPLTLRLLAGDHPAAVPYEFYALRSSGLYVHAPGAVEAIHDHQNSASFTVTPWSHQPSCLVIHGLHRATAIKIAQCLKLNGQPVTPAAHPRYLPNHDALILEVAAGRPSRVDIQIER